MATEMIPILLWLFFVFIIYIAVKNKAKKQAKKPTLQQQVNQAKYRETGRTIVEKRPRVDEMGLSAEELADRRQEQLRRAEALERKRYSMNKAGKAAAQDAAVLKAGDGFTLQDTKHDWLAAQLAEEQRAYRIVSEMFEVKMSHLRNCAAENARLDHMLSCDAKKLAEESRR